MFARHTIHLCRLGLIGTLAAAGCSDPSTPLSPEAIDGSPAGANALVLTERIVFSAIGPQGDRDIFSMNPDGSDLLRLTTDPGNDNEPAVSPDGRRIVFSRNDEDEASTHIWVINSDGSKSRQLTFGAGADNRFPAWSPDGRQIVFSAYVPGFDSEFEDADLHIMSANGRNRRILLGGPGEFGEDLAPVWSPDGTRIAFVRGSSTIVLMNPDGTGVTPLVSCSPCTGPAWSPDGSRIAYVTTTTIGAELKVKTLDAASPVFLAGNVKVGSGVSTWSPDGSRVLYVGATFETGYLGQFFTVNADGTGSQPLRSEGLPQEMEPSWALVRLNTPLTGSLATGAIR